MKALKRGSVVIAVMALLLGIGVALPSLAQGRSTSSDDRSTLDLSAMSRRGGEDRESSDDRGERSSNRSSGRSDDDSDDDADDESDDSRDEHGHRRGGSSHDDDAMSNLHWSGTLCDGEPISIDFSLRADAVQVDNVSGPANRVESTEGGARVYFDHVGARVSLRSERGGDRQVRLDARRGRCAQATTTTMVAPAPAPIPGDTAVTQPPASQPPATQPPVTTPPTQPPTTPAPPVTTIPTTVSTPPAKQIRYLTYNIGGEGSIAIQYDEPSNRIKFWSFTPNGAACWYTYDGKSLGTKVRTEFTDTTSFQATVGASGVAATYQGATIAPSGNSTVAPASTKSSC